MARAKERWSLKIKGETWLHHRGIRLSRDGADGDRDQKRVRAARINFWKMALRKLKMAKFGLAMSTLPLTRKAISGTKTQTVVASFFFIKSNQSWTKTPKGTGMTLVPLKVYLGQLCQIALGGLAKGKHDLTSVNPSSVGNKTGTSHGSWNNTLHVKEKKRQFWNFVSDLSFFLEMLSFSNL